MLNKQMNAIEILEGAARDLGFSDEYKDIREITDFIEDTTNRYIEFINKISDKLNPCQR